jgi:predicted PhzF superfamily epimerase YddE/YHI9
MTIPIFQVDAFSKSVFGGNPAAVCPLEQWLPDEILISIARENNLAETAFFIPDGEGFKLRWFTPEIEMDLCGHATLASAHVIFNHLNYSGDQIRFQSASGTLVVSQKGGLISMDFPSRIPKAVEVPEVILKGIGGNPILGLLARDYLLVFGTESEVRALKPDEGILGEINLDPGGVIVSAPGENCDFVSRFFTPQASIFEDPVTGSAHCTLVPYWSNKLGKKRLHAMQVSDRVGELFCEDRGSRVLISGYASTFLTGQLQLTGL